LLNVKIETGNELQIMNVVVVGPHPDDQEIAMGGTIALLRSQQHTVTIVDMTNGEPTPFGSPEVRQREAAEAARVLGVQRLSVGLPNREVLYGLEPRHRVAAIYRQLRPDILFIPYSQDAHPDHRQVTQIAEDARFDAKLTKSRIPGDPYYPPRIIYYFCSHLRFNFPASFSVDISSKMDTKLSAIKCYKSQFETGRAQAEQWRILDQIRSVNSYFGSTIKRPMAEPFYVLESLGLSDFDSIIL
jgi:bacillithiol biosynthesis deacetylase BshB1